MGRIKSFAGLAAAVMLLVGAASLAQAQSTDYWIPTGSGDWGDTNNNWSLLAAARTAASSIMAERRPSVPARVSWTLQWRGCMGRRQQRRWRHRRQWLCQYERRYPEWLHSAVMATTGPAISEVVGYDSGSGVFTQSGGLNCPFVNAPTNDAFSALTLGWGKGAYGEYDMSGGSLGVNAIMVGANCAMGGYPGPTTR